MIPATLVDSYCLKNDLKASTEEYYRRIASVYNRWWQGRVASGDGRGLASGEGTSSRQSSDRATSAPPTILPPPLANSSLPNRSANSWRINSGSGSRLTTASLFVADCEHYYATPTNGLPIVVFDQSAPT